MSTLTENEFVVVCKNCKASLEHEPGVGWVDDSGFAPTLCPDESVPEMLHVPVQQKEISHG
jgi:hypothetical protein